MNCKKCNIPGAPHEMIEGLCHACTARELAEVRNVHRSDLEKLKDALHIDKSGLASALNQVRKHCAGYSWAKESRGSYEWDDDEFYEEMGRLVDGAVDIIDKALKESGKFAHAFCCDAGERIDYKSRMERLESAVDRLVSVCTPGKFLTDTERQIVNEAAALVAKGQDSQSPIADSQGGGVR